MANKKPWQWWVLAFLTGGQVIALAITLIYTWVFTDWSATKSDGYAYSDSRAWGLLGFFLLEAAAAVSPIAVLVAPDYGGLFWNAGISNVLALASVFIGSIFAVSRRGNSNTNTGADDQYLFLTIIGFIWAGVNLLTIIDLISYSMHSVRENPEYKKVSKYGSSHSHA